MKTTRSLRPTTTSTVLKAPVPLNSDATPTKYVQSPGTSTSYTGNYLVFQSLANVNAQVVAVATNTGTPRALMCGIQFVAAPAPGEAGPSQNGEFLPQVGVATGPLVSIV